jgi:hypothetical protein
MSSSTAHLTGVLLQQLWLLLLLLFNEDRLLLGSIWCCDGLHSIH